MTKYPVRIVAELELAHASLAPQRWFIAAFVGEYRVSMSFGDSMGYASAAEAGAIIGVMRAAWMMSLMEKRHAIEVVVGTDHEAQRFITKTLAELADFHAV